MQVVPMIAPALFRRVADARGRVSLQAGEKIKKACTPEVENTPFCFGINRHRLPSKPQVLRKAGRGECSAPGAGGPYFLRSAP